MARLLDYFTPCVSAGLRLAEKLDQSTEHLEPAAAVRKSLRNDILTARAAAESDVRSRADVDLVVFAIVAWIDEVMLRYPEWGRGVDNLQGELLGTQIAREVFFSNLEDLTPEQDEVREVYYLILVLGFEGFYGQLESGKEELERLKDLHERQLKMLPLAPGSLVDDKITPQPYSVQPPELPKPPPEPPPPPPPPPWGLLAAAAALLLLVVGGGFLGLQASADRIADKAIAELQCAAVRASIGFDRVARLEGHVESFIDQQQLIETVGGARFVSRVESLLDVQSWPFCEVLLAVESLKQQSDVESLGASIRLAGGVDRLRDQEYVVVEGTTPKFDGFVYIYNIRGDGGVVHLLPNTILTDNQRFVGDLITVGDAESGVRLRVRGPFGKEMLLIVAMTEPLLSTNVRNSSEFADFIEELRSGLAEIDRANGQAAANYFFLETQP